MPWIRVEDLKPHAADASGNRVLCIYAKKPPDYAVYNDSMRVSVHFADDTRRELLQRKALACLYPLRGEISGLIDGWRHEFDEPVRPMRRRGGEHDAGAEEDGKPGVFSRLASAFSAGTVRRDRARARRYDRRVADAMIMGLEDSVPQAVELLEGIRDDVIAERKAFAHTDYLLTAALAGLLFLIAIGIATSPAIGLVRNPPPNWGIIWTGAAAGVIGAFFSVAIALRSRTILIDLQKWDNRRDAILRIAVGTMGAGILLCLFLTGLVTISGFTAANLKPGPNNDPVLWAVVIGFIAGFSERIVPDLLSKASFAAPERTAAVSQAKAAAVKSESTASALSAPPPTPAVNLATSLDDDDADSCACDLPADAAQVLTRDEDLPITVGGVSTDVKVADPAVAKSDPQLTD